MTTRKDLPSEKATNFDQRLRETIQTYLGRQGDPLDRGLTLRDLVDNGFATVTNGWRGGAGTVPLIPGDAVASTDSSLDLTPPPTPTGFRVSAAISNLFIETDAPLFKAGGGYLSTVVYGATRLAGQPAPTFAKAVQITEFQGQVFAHATNPATTWHLWVKWKTKAGVLSSSPAGGTNGQVTTTGQDVTLLLDALSGEIRTSELVESLNDRIDLIDGPESLAGSVAARVAQEVQDRVTAVAAEAAQRADSISIESHQRMVQITDVANAALNALIAAESERVDRTEDVALARSDLDAALVAGLSAEAAARDVLLTRINGNEAAVLDEITARSDAVSAEAAERNLLAVQLRGSYDGSDITAVTSGLLFSEKTARVDADAAIVEQITLLSAGAGEQFDWLKIWYFDAGIESWTGISTPTMASGWLKPVGGPAVTSPSALAVEAAKYSQIRFRIRKTGTLTWSGVLSWNGGSTTVDEPTYDANGIGLVTANMPWTGTIDYISISAYTTQGTVSDFYEIDWVAIGRPSPGASSAQLLEEEQVRAAADVAEANSRKALSTKIVGVDDPTGLTLPSLSSGLLFDEASLRTTGDATQATKTETLSVKLTGYNVIPDGTTLASLSSGLLFDEKFARSAADSVEVGLRETLSATLTGTTDPSGLTLDDLTSGVIFEEKLARVEVGNSVNTVNQTLISTSRRLDVQAAEDAETMLRNTIANDNNLRNFSEDIAIAREELYTEVERGVSSEASARLLLAAKVDDNLALLSDEQRVRAEADSVLVESITTMGGEVDDLRADITTETQLRVDGDEAIASSVTTVQSRLNSRLNMLPNGGLTLGRSLWSGDLYNSFTLLETAPWGPRLESYTVNNGTGFLYCDPVPVAGEEWYSVHADALCLADTGAVYVDMQFINGSGTPTGSTPVLKFSSFDYSTTDTNRSAIANEFQAPSDAVTCMVRFVWFGLTNCTALGIRLLKLEHGRLPYSQFTDGSLKSLHASIETEATTRVTQTGELYAQYTVKADVGGLISGYGLASTANNAAPTSLFGIQASQFFVGPPTVAQVSAPTADLYPGYVWRDTTSNVTKYRNDTNDGWVTTPPRLPFVIQATPTTINGVSVAAGVYMDTAFIRDGTITNVKIGNAQIDDAKVANLSASKLTAGAIAVGQYIGSSDYISGSQGWLIHGDGSAEFGSASIRGQLTASQIDSRNLTIKDASGNVIFGASQNLALSRVAGVGALASQNTVNIDESESTVSINYGTPASPVWLPLRKIDFVNSLNRINSGTISTFMESAAIGNAYIGDAAISEAKIQDAAITNAKIQNAAITSAKIADAQITNAKIGTAQVDTLKIAGNSATYWLGDVQAGDTAYIGFSLPYDATAILIGTCANSVAETSTLYLNGGAARQVYAQGAIGMVFKADLGAGSHAVSMVTGTGGSNASLAVAISYR